MKATILLATTKDRGPILQYSVGSVLQQTETDWELFIVGDGVSEMTRQAAQALASSDRRIRFFDFPEDASRGEANRHRLLSEEASGEIVCYLCDRDLYLPNHVAEMYALLQDADFGHTMHVTTLPNGRFKLSITPLNCGDVTDSLSDLLAFSAIPLSMMGHRLDAYKKLPHGWRPTPSGLYTDWYMEKQFLEQDWLNAAVSSRPTVVYLKRGDHADTPTSERVGESQRFSEKYARPDGDAFFQRDLNAFLAQSASQEVLRAEKRIQRFPHSVKRGIGQALRRLVRISPYRKLRRDYRNSRSQGKDLMAKPPARRDLKRFEVTREIHIDVFWKVLEIGRGPALSLYVLGHEALKFDCFGHRDGHFHVDLIQPTRGAKESRIFFREESVAAQIDEALYQLETNAAYYLQRHPNKYVQSFRFKSACIAPLVPELRELMLEYQRRTPTDPKKQVADAKAAATVSGGGDAGE